LRLLKWILLGIGAIVGVIKKYPQIKGRDIPPLERRMHQPSAVPDRIVLSWKSDPATSQAVTWRTDVDVDGAVAQIGLASAAPGRGELVGFSDSTRSVNAVSTRLETDLDIALYHAAEFTGLTPSTRYAYRVGDGVHWSEWFHFRTAAATAEPFSFIYLGDAQNNLKSFWSSAIRAVYVQDSAARFIIHAGDLVEHGKWDAEWGEWFYAAGWINGMVPLVPMPGNHEYVEYSIYNRVLDRGSLTRHWRPLFTLPKHGPPGLEETVYYF
jgi:hypothetical protein